MSAARALQPDRSTRPDRSTHPDRSTRPDRPIRTAGSAGSAGSPGSSRSTGTGEAPFEVHLDNFAGPFDLLLQLVSRHRMDITEVALSQVTDEFIAHLRAAGPDWDLDRTSQFVMVAATLLDLKAARLLPTGEVEDDDDIAALETRDLLFARLLQYRAFKEVAAELAAAFDTESRRHPRRPTPEPRFAGLLAPLVITASAERLARVAARALAPRPLPLASAEHLHAPRVSVRGQAALLADLLRGSGAVSFRRLVAGADRPTTVARFLALLELFREAAVVFEQPAALGDLTVRWTGPADRPVAVSDEFEQPPGGGDAATRSSQGAR